MLSCQHFVYFLLLFFLSTCIPLSWKGLKIRRPNVMFLWNLGSVEISKRKLIKAVPASSKAFNIQQQCQPQQWLLLSLACLSACSASSSAKVPTAVVGLKFKKSQDSARIAGKPWTVSCLCWAKAPCGWLKSRVLWRQWHLHPALNPHGNVSACSLKTSFRSS